MTATARRHTGQSDDGADPEAASRNQAKPLMEDYSARTVGVSKGSRRTVVHASKRTTTLTDAPGRLLVEIADYLKVARRRLWILLLVPVLAAGAAMAYGKTRPITYSATATVRTPGLVGTAYSQFNGPQAIGQFVSAFAASAADPFVVSQTAKETGVSDALLGSNVSVAQVGASSNVTLTYSGPDGSSSERVAKALAANALTNLYTAQGRIADLQAEAAKKEVDAANQVLSAYLVKVGLPNPPASYQTALSQLAWLQQTQANYVAEGNTIAADAMRGSVDGVRKQVDTIGGTLTQYNALLSAQTSASTTYQSVLADQRKVQAQAAAAAADDVIATNSATPDMTTAKLVKLVLPITGAAVLLAIMLIALLEFVRAARRQPASAPLRKRKRLSGQDRSPLRIGA